MSWEDIRKQLYEHDDFGRELKKKLPSGFIPADILTEKDEMEKAKNTCSCSKSFKWDRVHDFTSDNGSNNLIKTKIGSVGDINLTLVKMLREAGITTNPLVLSTINNGFISYNPSMNSLNYVIACSEINGSFILWMPPINNLLSMFCLPKYTTTEDS